MSASDIKKVPGIMKTPDFWSTQHKGFIGGVAKYRSRAQLVEGGSTVLTCSGTNCNIEGDGFASRPACVVGVCYAVYLDYGYGVCPEFIKRAARAKFEHGPVSYSFYPI